MDSNRLLSSGLTKEDLAIITNAIRQVLKDHQHPTLWLFGSRARGDQQKHSDIDLLLSESESVSPDQEATIRETLEESNLPFKVDFLLENDLYESYRKSFLSERIQIAEF